MRKLSCKKIRLQLPFFFPTNFFQFCVPGTRYTILVYIRLAASLVYRYVDRAVLSGAIIYCISIVLFYGPETVLENLASTAKSMKMANHCLQKHAACRMPQRASLCLAAVIASKTAKTLILTTLAI